MKPNKTKAIDALEAMWAEVREARDTTLGATLDSKPPGAFTVNEYGARFNLGREGARHEIGRLLGAGKLRKLRAWILNCDGKRVRGTIYQPID